MICRTLLVGAMCSLALASTASGSDQTLAATLVPEIKSCMVVPELAKSTGDTATIDIELVHGELVGEPTAAVKPVTAVQKAMLAAAIRAVKKCGPYRRDISLSLRVHFIPNE